LRRSLNRKVIHLKASTHSAVYGTYTSKPKHSTPISKCLKGIPSNPPFQILYTLKG
jgi:hypothetical protein